MNAFAALADTNRREIVRLIAHRGELSVSEICEEFTITPPAVSQHLKVLREAKVIRMKKQAQKRLYSVDESGLNEVGDWILAIRKQWNRLLNLYRLGWFSSKYGAGVDSYSSQYIATSTICQLRSHSIRRQRPTRQWHDDCHRWWGWLGNDRKQLASDRWRI